MTPKQLKTAARLYKQYKTDTAEYRELASELGMQVTDLNKRMWHHFSIQKTAALAAKLVKN